MNIRVIALDLDGTLLNSDKVISPADYAALERAAAMGVHIVPTTGRFYDAMPDVVRQLPFVRYAITVNGAQVADLRTGEVIYRAELPWQQAVDIMTELDSHPVIYDCFMDNRAYMTADQRPFIDTMIASPHYRKMFRELREPVPELKSFLSERGHNVQKIQFFTNQPQLRLELMKKLPRQFDHLIISSSVGDNVEINQSRANKGEALLALAAHLDVPRAATAAFGDGLNDLTMLREAGVGVAMANACHEALALADRVTLSCDEDGVAHGIYAMCFGKNF